MCNSYSLYVTHKVRMQSVTSECYSSVYHLYFVWLFSVSVRHRLPLLTCLRGYFLI